MHHPSTAAQPQARITATLQRTCRLRCRRARAAAAASGTTAPPLLQGRPQALCLLVHHDVHQGDDLRGVPAGIGDRGGADRGRGPRGGPRGGESVRGRSQGRSVRLGRVAGPTRTRVVRSCAVGTAGGSEPAADGTDTPTSSGIPSDYRCAEKSLSPMRYDKITQHSLA